MISGFYSTGDAWAVNGSDDPIHILYNDMLIDSASPDKDDITRRQSDSTFVADEQKTTSGAHGAPLTLPDYQSPIYIYEIGERGSDTRLTLYNGNYVMLYIAGVELVQ